MADAEKALLQAQRRVEEAQARNRVKGRKARTRRLIQIGAILEKVLAGGRRWYPSRWSGTRALRGGMRLLREPMDNALADAAMLPVD